MTRNEALVIAKQNYAAHSKADIEHLFKGGPAFDALADYGYRHGWYRVEEHSFCNDELSGVPYDITQGGWAFI